MAEITIMIGTDIGQVWSLQDGALETIVCSFGRSAVVRNVPSGHYTISWSEVPGYNPPVPMMEGPVWVNDSHVFDAPTYMPTVRLEIEFLNG